MKRALFIVPLLLLGAMLFAQSVTLGDVNSSGSIDIVDALLVAQYSVGQNPSNFNSAYADVNCSGAIDIIDALLIAQLSVGQITKLPCTLTTTKPPATPTIAPTPTPGSKLIKGSEVLLIGDSVIALSRDITKDLNALGKQDGYLASNDNFRDNAVSGMRLAGGGTPTIPQQYANGKQSSPVKWVFMDGGGNDCLQANCPSPVSSSCADLQNAANALKTLYAQMASDGVKAVVYFFYYDAPSDPREKLTVLRPMVQSVVNATTSPKIYFIDLRPFFSGHPEYLISDGLHPSAAGSQVIANAVWDVVKKNNLLTN